MINSVQLKNFGPLTELDWQHLGQINLVIGNNGCGKSFLLKALYTAVRTLEDFKRGDNPDSAAEILADKLFWTFQAEKISDLVSKKAESSLVFELIFDDKSFSYSFGKDTTKVIHLENQATPRPDNSIFLPAKEVLSLHHIILKSRQQDQVFGFDDTYLDLAKALQTRPSNVKKYFGFREAGGGASPLNYGSFYRPDPSKKGQGSNDFDSSRQLLESMIGGTIEYDETNRWYFKKNGQRFPMGTTAEGIKKIAILD